MIITGAIRRHHSQFRTLNCGWFFVYTVVDVAVIVYVYVCHLGESTFLRSCHTQTQHNTKAQFENRLVKSYFTYPVIYCSAPWLRLCWIIGKLHTPTLPNFRLGRWYRPTTTSTFGRPPPTVYVLPDILCIIGPLIITRIRYLFITFRDVNHEYGMNCGPPPHVFVPVHGRSCMSSCCCYSFYFYNLLVHTKWMGRGEEREPGHGWVVV